MGWAHWMPGYAGLRLLMDRASMSDFVEGRVVVRDPRPDRGADGTVVLVLERGVKS